MQTTTKPAQAEPSQVTITTVGPDGQTRTISASKEGVQIARGAEPALAPVAVVEPPRPFPSDKIISLGIIGSIIVLFPISVAVAIRMLRKPRAQAALTAGVEERFTRLEQSIDAIAIEMERVSEGQRYVTKLLATEKVS